jgi:hypothetical protein
VPHAVLFKIYFLDSFVIRQLERLQKRVGGGDLYVIVDETKGPIGPVPHDRVLRSSEADMVRRGFVDFDPVSAMFWHSADYSLYPLLEDFPPYDHYVSVEYDAVINGDIGALVATMAAQKVDFIGRRIDEPVSQWGWTPTCDTIYDAADLRPYLNAISFYSLRAVRHLRERRLELSRLFRDGKISQFPMSEAFIGTELALKGYSLGNLPDFGDTSRFTWWPPSVEDELPELAHCTFIHPVLEGARCAASLIRDNLVGIFGPGDIRIDRLARLRPRDYIPALFPALANLHREQPMVFAMDQVSAALFEEPDPAPNVALRKPATQSSISSASRWHTLQGDAAGAVNGLVTGTYGFHTGFDDPPWWMVDLENPHRLSAVWIYNRLDVPSRLPHLRLLISTNSREWILSLDHRSDGLFGGAWGTPLMIAFEPPAVARFVRIELGEPGYLLLDQVKVFGMPVEPVSVDQAPA